MSDPSNNSPLAAELQPLLIAVALGDATDAQIERVNELLLLDGTLRHQAARFFEEETVLRREFEVLDRVVDFHNGPARDRGTERPQVRATRTTCEPRFQIGSRSRLFIAVSVLLATALGVLWIERQSGIIAFDPASRDGQSTLPPGAHDLENASLPHSLTPLTASILWPVTRVSWSGPQFAAEANDGPLDAAMRAGDSQLTSAMHEGVVSFTSAFGRPAEGYVVCLQPGALLDLVVSADSDGENALAVIEFDASGRPTGRRISFSNSAGEDAADPAGAGKFLVLTKKGRLGIWSERNDTASPRYYLFTGVHKLLNRSADDSWHVSRLLAFVEQPNLFHIGWDDSGMLATGEHDPIHIADDDFDDVSATIRIRRSTPEPQRSPQSVHIYSKTASYDADPQLTAAGNSSGHHFSLAPGQIAIVKVCSRSAAQVEVAVVDGETKSLLWHCRKELVRSPTLGICAMANDSPSPHEFYLVAQKTPGNNSESRKPQLMSHSVLFEKETLTTVGFEDGPHAADFNTVRVDILKTDEL